MTKQPDAIAPEVLADALMEIPEVPAENVNEIAQTLETVLVLSGDKPDEAVEQPPVVRLKLKVYGEEKEQTFTASEIVAIAQKESALEARFREVGEWRRELLPFRRIIASDEFREFVEYLTANGSPLSNPPDEPLEFPPQIPALPGDPNQFIVRDDANYQEREKALRQRMEHGDVGSAAALALLTLKRNPRILDKELKYE